MPVVGGGRRAEFAEAVEAQVHRLLMLADVVGRVPSLAPSGCRPNSRLMRILSSSSRVRNSKGVRKLRLALGLRVDDVGAGFLVRRLGLLDTVGRRRGVGHDGVELVGGLLGRGHMYM